MTVVLETGLNTQVCNYSRGRRAQPYNFPIENGSEPLRKEEIDETMNDCGVVEDLNTQVGK